MSVVWQKTEEWPEFVEGFITFECFLWQEGRFVLVGVPWNVVQLAVLRPVLQCCHLPPSLSTSY